MELLSARMSIPLRPATVNAISWRYPQTPTLPKRVKFAKAFAKQ
jgi:hypothetical protein